MPRSKKHNSKYSPEFKISVIMDMREHGLSYKATMRKYFSDFPTKNYYFLKQWERIYLSEEDAVILDNWLKELSTRYDFQNNFDYCGDIYTRSDYEPDFYDYLNWIEENATSGFYQIIYRWLVDEEFDDDLNQILANTILLPNEQVAIAVVYPLVQNSLVEFESRGGVDQCYDQYNSDIKRCKRDYHITMAVVTAVSVLSGGSAAPAAAVSLVGNTVALKSCMDGAARTFDICVKYAK